VLLLLSVISISARYIGKPRDAVSELRDNLTSALLALNL